MNTNNIVKIIALEGLDCVGKSFVIEKLGKEKDFVVVKHPYPSDLLKRKKEITSNNFKNIVFPFYIETLKLLKECRYSVIFDRFLGSIYAYEYANDNISAIESQFDYIVAFINNLGYKVYIVYINTKLDNNYITKLKEHKEGILDLNYYKKVQRGFNDFMRKYNKYFNCYVADDSNRAINLIKIIQE